MRCHAHGLLLCSTNGCTRLFGYHSCYSLPAQDKVEYLSNEIKMLEEEKANCSKHLLLLNKRRDEYMESMYTYESFLAQKREKMAMDKGTKMLPRPINHDADDLYSLTYSEPDTNSYAIRLSYTVMDDLMDEIHSRQD
jgi:hypothetical protein